MRYLTVVKKGSSTRGSRRYKRKSYRKKPSKYGTTRIHRTKLMGTRHAGQKHHLVRKAFLGIAPWVQEIGGTINDNIRNFQLKSAPRDGNGAFNYQWDLTAFPGYTTINQIYQYYRIRAVTICFYPEQNSYPAARTDAQNVTYDASSGQKATAPTLIYAVDRADSNLFTSVNDALAHEGSKMHVFNGSEELTVSLRPTPLTTVGTGGGVDVAGKMTWIPTSSTGEKHLGLKCYMNRMSDYISIRVVMNMTVEFKDTKI